MIRTSCLKTGLRIVAPIILFAIFCAPDNSSRVIADDAPQWLRQAATAKPPAYENNVSAAVLLKEQNIKVDDDGRVTTTEHYAVRVLTSEGREEASASVSYLTDTGKVRDMRAWVIRPSAEVKKIEKEKVFDLAAAPNDVFNEVRIKMISARDEVEPGAIFGCEWTSEDKSVFTQFDWQFQDRLPVAISRVSITLPAGWRAEGITLNHPNIEPVITGTTYTWELRDLSNISDEPASPPLTTLGPRLAISYFPPADKQIGIGRAFASWTDVSRWLSELSDSQASVNDALAKKAKEITASARSELERIQSIGRFVQGVNYVSIQTGIGRGGGYRPHAATDVLAKSYGDCKDKANLMRAMLKAVAIESYLVGIYSGDQYYVREEWPSPQQFNHCIIAIKVSDDTQASSIIKQSGLGRLLIFDPTDSYTLVGDLPMHEQGSLALIVAGDKGALTRMPVAPPEANSLVRRADVTLGPDGAISAVINERALGHSAAVERSRFHRLSGQDYRKMIERWITFSSTGATITKIEPADSLSDGKFSLDVEFKADRYAQLMQERLLVFKPAVVSRRESLFLTEPTRKYPVVLESHAYTETVKVKLPKGFDIDELPDAVMLNAGFGSYSTNYEVREGNLTFTRSLVLKGGIIPVADYAQVRSFFEKIRVAEQAPVVLVRK